MLSARPRDNDLGKKDNIINGIGTDCTLTSWCGMLIVNTESYKTRKVKRRIKMKKSFMSFLAFIGVIAFLVAPGVVAADNIPLSPVQNISVFINCLESSSCAPAAPLGNVVVEYDPSAPFTYTPTQTGTQPGYSAALSTTIQHTYSITDPPVTTGYFPVVDPMYTVNGVVLFTNNPSLTVSSLPNASDLTGSGSWTDPAFVSELSAVIVFLDGASSTVFSYENSSTSVPEPGVLFLLGSGLIGLVGVRRMIKK